MLTLRGVLDLDLPSGNGKALHLQATSDIADLSAYAVGVANNGGGTDGPEYTLTNTSVSAGEHILLARDASVFANCSSRFEHAVDAAVFDLAHAQHASNHARRSRRVNGAVARIELGAVRDARSREGRPADFR